MFSLRRVKTIKVFKDGSQLFIKSSLLKSFSSEVIRTTFVLFTDNVPKKGFCECAVGKCGLCCHIIVIVILLQLEHFTTHKRLFASLIDISRRLRHDAVTWSLLGKQTRNTSSLCSELCSLLINFFRLCGHGSLLLCFRL